MPSPVDYMDLLYDMFPGTTQATLDLSALDGSNSLYDAVTFDYFNADVWLDHYGYGIPIWGDRGDQIDLINWASETELNQIENELRRDLASEMTQPLFTGLSLGRVGDPLAKFKAETTENLYDQYRKEAQVYDSYAAEVYDAFGAMGSSAFDPDELEDLDPNIWTEGASWEEFQELGIDFGPEAGQGTNVGPIWSDWVPIESDYCNQGFALAANMQGLQNIDEIIEEFYADPYNSFAFGPGGIFADGVHDPDSDEIYWLQNCWEYIGDDDSGG